MGVGHSPLKKDGTLSEVLLSMLQECEVFFPVITRKDGVSVFGSNCRESVVTTAYTLTRRVALGVGNQDVRAERFDCLSLQGLKCHTQQAASKHTSRERRSFCDVPQNSAR